MTLRNPWGFTGKLEFDADYAVGVSRGKLRLDSSGNGEVTLSPKWGSFDHILIACHFKYALTINPMNKMMIAKYEAINAAGGELEADNLFENKGGFACSANWMVSFSDTGLKIHPDGTQPKALGTSWHQGDIVVAAASPKIASSELGDKIAYVELTLPVLAGLEQKGVQVGLRAGPLSAGTTIGASNRSDGIETTFRINIKTEKPTAPIVAPKIAVPKIPQSYLTADPILFPEQKFSPTSDSSSKLKAWVGKLQDLEPLGEVIVAGKVPIEIQAFASTTGSPMVNKQVTDRRANVAKEVLKSLFKSSTLKFEVLSFGKEKAVGQGRDYDYNRRVEIGIDGNKAKTAMEQFLKQ